MIEGLKVRIKATTMSAMPFHRMRLADMTVLVQVRELTAWVTAINCRQLQMERYQVCSIPSDLLRQHQYPLLEIVAPEG